MDPVHLNITPQYQSPTPPYSDAVAGYLHQSLADNTHRAYEADLAHFRAWGGTIPTTSEAVAEYLAGHAPTLSMATLDRRAVAISKAHAERGFPSPTQSGLVRAVRRGIKRVHGKAQRRTAPLSTSDLLPVLEAMGEGEKAIRDRALILLGFAGAFRRSELVALDRDDLEFVRQGLVVYLRHSKTDQVYEGRKLGVPYGSDPLCPVKALTDWLSLLPTTYGPIFGRVDRHGNVLDQRLSPEAVSLIVKGRVAAAGFDPSLYSGHSLRAGFATAAAQAGVAGWRIRQQTGHASDAMLARYIRDGELFGDSAVGALL
jgi:integrase